MNPFQEINYFQIFKALLHLTGFFLGISALFQSRTPQGAMAWLISLIAFPYVSIPLFVAFGKKKYFDGAIKKRSKFPLREKLIHPKNLLGDFTNFLKHTGSGFTGNNTINLLVDGEEIYGAMLDEIDKANDYIILQVYIFRTDETGKRFAEALKKRAQAGVKVYVLYEKVLIKMSNAVLKDMQTSGIKIGLFKPFQRNKWHLNFRNHRKILIVDGRVGFFGGLNIGDDYVGKYPQIGPWRDTNVKISGPALIPAQRTFANDWHSSQGYTCDIEWKIIPSDGKSNVLIFSSGPVEEKPLCLLHHIALISMSNKRLWIANPYIVPPQSLMDVLALAALRGVDVRLLVPQKNDNWLITAVNQIYYEKLTDFGVKIFRYHAGFLHHKVMLIDDLMGIVGSANFDYRSMYINFEITTVSSDYPFVMELEEMFLKDFQQSFQIQKDEFTKISLPVKIFQRGVNLLAPVL